MLFVREVFLSSPNTGTSPATRPMPDAERIGWVQKNPIGIDIDHGTVQELSRVVRPGDKLFLQANFSDRKPYVWWLRVVPKWMKVHQALNRTEEQVRGDLAGAGWRLVSRDDVTCFGQQAWWRTSRG